ncbi:MAG: VWA domain-containing protein [Verrucomicrobiales bacterium]|nr:VWA domain-containing protein [Verrucomicrobiales bacterium]
MEIFLQWIGFDRDSIPEGAEVSFHFANLPESWAVFVFSGIVLLIGWFIYKLYRKENDACPVWAKKVLALIRMTVCLFLLFVFLEPSLSYTKSRSLRPVIAVLRDSSESMNIKDRYLDEGSAKAAASVMGITVEELRSGKTSRVDVVNKILNEGDSELIKELGKKGRLKVLDFSDRVTEVDVQEENSSEDDNEGEVVGLNEKQIAFHSLEAKGPGTDLSGAISEAITEKLTSAVIVFTDGQHNASSSVNEVVSSSRKRNVPIFFIGMGDSDRPQNISVTNLYADPQVWNNDPFQIQAILRAEGIEKESVKVDLIELVESDDGESIERIIESKDLELESGDDQIRMDFLHTPKSPGPKRFIVRSTVLDQESNKDDNEPPSPVRVQVLDDNAKVLMISGGPSWEYRALARLLNREKMINLSCWLQSLDEGRLQQGNTPIQRMPSTREELFNYDVVIMLDPDPREFDAELITLYKQFVREHSGGLLYMPGPVFGGRFLTGSQTAEISEILPVRLGDVGSMEVDGLLSSNDREWPLTIVAANTDQPIMRFYNDPQKTLIQWKKLPGTYWSFPALEPKPATRVLIEHSDPTLRRKEVARPLLVTGQYGSGRTTYLGFDGTWRWRTKGLDAEFFKRFWIQTTRYLVEGRSLSGKRRGIIETEKFRYQIGDRIKINARLKEQNFEWLIAEEIKGQLKLPGEDPSENTYTALKNQPGLYEATIVASKEGSYSVSVELSGEGEEKVNIDSNFTVTLPLKEIKDTWLDRNKLIELAKLSGTAYLNPDKLQGLPSEIPDMTRNLAFESPPFPLWDNRIQFIVLVAHLTLECALRKKYKLL